MRETIYYCMVGDGEWQRLVKAKNFRSAKIITSRAYKDIYLDLYIAQIDKNDVKNDLIDIQKANIYKRKPIFNGPDGKFMRNEWLPLANIN